VLKNLVNSIKELLGEDSPRRITKLLVVVIISYICGEHFQCEFICRSRSHCSKTHVLLTNISMVKGCICGAKYEIHSLHDYKVPRIIIIQVYEIPSFKMIIKVMHAQCLIYFIHGILFSEVKKSTHKPLFFFNSPIPLYLHLIKKSSKILIFHMNVKSQ
jgi:hypothetical protein